MLWNRFGSEIYNNLEVRLAICFEDATWRHSRWLPAGGVELCLFSADSLQSCSTLVHFALMWNQHLWPLFDTGPSRISRFDQHPFKSSLPWCVGKIMLIKEYRIPLPMSVDEYRIAQLYMIQVWLYCIAFYVPTVLNVQRCYIATAISSRFCVLFGPMFVYVHVKFMYLQHSLSLVNKL